MTAGPSLTGTVSTQSGNTISAASGIYFEDYYYNSTCYAQGGKYLDSHAGHSHQPMGYHYHVTIDSNGVGTFPYVGGPRYYGCRSTCCSSRTSNTCTGTSTCGTSDGVTSYGCSAAVTPTNAPSFSNPPSHQPTPTPETSSHHSSSESSSNDALTIGLAVGIGGGVLVMGTLGYFCFWSNTAKNKPDLELGNR